MALSYYDHYSPCYYSYQKIPGDVCTDVPSSPFLASSKLCPPVAPDGLKLMLGVNVEFSTGEVIEFVLTQESVSPQCTKIEGMRMSHSYQTLLPNDADINGIVLLNTNRTENCFIHSVLCACIIQGWTNQTHYLWDFGDGSRVSSMGLDANAAQQHTYETEGVYTVTVTASNDAGSSSDSLTVFIAGATIYYMTT